MPSRRDIFINGGIYHIYNKTLDHKNIFKTSQVAERLLDLIYYYRSCRSDLRYSMFVKLRGQIKLDRIKQIENPENFKVEILSYCIMPNHFHILIKQIKENGIVRFTGDIVNAITRYFNVLANRKGPLFLTQFRSRRILTREQLIHVSRYIHLNPYSSGVVTDLGKLEDYPYSSLGEYLGKTSRHLCEINVVLKQFVKRETYRKFIYDNAVYQKSLEHIKYVEKWI